MDEERISQEATEWVIWLQDEPDDAELRARFDVWRDADPAHARAWAEVSKVYDLIGLIPPAHADRWTQPRAEAARPPTAEIITFADIKKPVRRAVVGRAVAGLASLAVAASLAIGFMPGLLVHFRADFSTGTAELRTITLPDGSIVQLAADSALSIESFGPTGRKVNLLSGEAFFQVTHDPSRPFEVSSNGVRTTVLGTRFDVKREADRAGVSVEEGVVRVESEGAAPMSHPLRAGDWVRFSADGTTTEGTQPAEQVAVWRQGQIVARDRAIADVVNDLRPYYSGRIVLLSDAFGRQHVTGVYSVNDPIAALRAVVKPYGGSVRQISPWLAVVTVE